MIGQQPRVESLFYYFPWKTRFPLIVGVYLSPCINSASNTGGHAPIVIQSDADFTNCACVVKGSGVATDPYIIGPWTINNVSGNAVTVDGTKLTKSFVSVT